MRICNPSLTQIACSQSCRVRPNEQELEECARGPFKEFKSGWDSYFKDKPDKPVMHYSVIAGWFGDHMLVPPGNFFTMFHFLEYPFSRGFIHITSPSAYDAPDFDAGFVSHCPTFNVLYHCL